MEEEMVGSAAKRKREKKTNLKEENGTPIPKCRKSLTKTPLPKITSPISLIRKTLSPYQIPKISPLIPP